jgi:hypothetical protein
MSNSWYSANFYYMQVPTIYKLTSINSSLGTLERQNSHTYATLQDRASQPSVPLAC